MIRYLLSGLLALLMAGCAAGPVPFTPVNSQQALVRWSRPGNTLVAEAVFSRARDGAVRAQLYKGSPKIMLTLSISPAKIFRASGPLAGFGWRGEASTAPLALATWSRLLQDYQSAPSWPEGENEIHTSDARTAVTISRHQVQVLSVSNNLNRESLTAKFRAP